MSDRELMPIDWKKTDVENFSELMARGFADRNMEYLPGGLVLKKPIQVEDVHGSSEIQVIGIPFKNVFGKTKFRYNRVKLSEFEYLNKQLMGDEFTPIRLKEVDNEETVLEETKKVLSKRLSILPQRFVLELIEKQVKDSGDPKYKYKFYFNIPETDFTDKANGLSIINDKDVFVYVEKTNIKIENGQAIVIIEDMAESQKETSAGLVSNDPYSSYSKILPAEYRLINTTVGEDFGAKPKNEILFKSPGGRFRGQISDDLKADLTEISVTGNSTYNNGKVSGTIKVGFTQSSPSSLNGDEVNTDPEMKLPTFEYAYRGALCTRLGNEGSRSGTFDPVFYGLPFIGSPDMINIEIDGRSAEVVYTNYLDLEPKFFVKSDKPNRGGVAANISAGQVKIEPYTGLVFFSDEDIGKPYRIRYKYYKGDSLGIGEEIIE